MSNHLRVVDVHMATGESGRMLFHTPPTEWRILAQLRNTLVRRYTTVTPGQVYDQVREVVPAWQEYLASIQGRLRERPPER